MKTIPHSFSVRIKREAQDLKSLCSSQGLGAQIFFDKLITAFYLVYEECLIYTNDDQNMAFYDQEMRKLFNDHFQGYNIGGIIPDFYGDFQKMLNEFQQGLNNIYTRVHAGMARKSRNEGYSFWMSLITCITSIVACIASAGALTIMLIDKFSK